MKSLEKTLIEEAVRRGYSGGVLIDYEGSLKGTDTLGNGEFKLIGNSLVKYETNNLKDRFRRFDTVYSYVNGWTKISEKKHGLSF